MVLYLLLNMALLGCAFFRGDPNPLWDCKKKLIAVSFKVLQPRKGNTHDNQLPVPYPRNPRLQIPKDRTHGRYRDLLSPFQSPSVGLSELPVKGNHRCPNGENTRYPRPLHRFKKNDTARRNTPDSVSGMRCVNAGAHRILLRPLCTPYQVGRPLCAGAPLRNVDQGRGAIHGNALGNGQKH